MRDSLPSPEAVARKPALIRVCGVKVTDYGPGVILTLPHVLAVLAEAPNAVRQSPLAFIQNGYS